MRKICKLMDIKFNKSLVNSLLMEKWWEIVYQIKNITLTPN